MDEVITRIKGEACIAGYSRVELRFENIERDNETVVVEVEHANA